MSVVMCVVSEKSLIFKVALIPNNFIRSCYNFLDRCFSMIRILCLNVFLTRVAWPVPVVEEAYSSDHLSSPLVFSGVCVGHCLSFYPCSFGIVLSGLRVTALEYPFCIFKLFLRTGDSDLYKWRWSSMMKGYKRPYKGEIK